jgi:hypothetical protein
MKEQFAIIILFFALALLGFWGALNFSKYKAKKEKPCEDEEDCEIKKLGIKNLDCDSK